MKPEDLEKLSLAPLEFKESLTDRAIPRYMTPGPKMTSVNDGDKVDDESKPNTGRVRGFLFKQETLPEANILKLGNFKSPLPMIPTMNEIE